MKVADRPTSPHPRQEITSMRSRLTQVILIISLLFTSTLGPPPPAAANGIEGEISKAVPLVGFLVGWHHRNRVYRQANRFIGDRRAYYDGLRDYARRQMQQRELRTFGKSQGAAYIKVVALIEGERETVFQVAENRKRQARREFHERIEDTLLFAISGSRLGKQLFRAMKNGIGSAQEFVDRALSTLTGGQSELLGDLNRIRRIANQVSIVSGAIGGRAGRNMKRMCDRIVKSIDRPQAEVLAVLAEAKAQLTMLDMMVDDMSQVGRVPSAGAVLDKVTASFLPSGEENQDPALEAIASVLSKLKAGDGSLKDEARNAIQAGQMARCVYRAKAFQQQVTALIQGNGEEKSGCTELDEILEFSEDDEESTATDPGQPIQPEPTVTATATETPPIVTASGAFSEVCNRGDCPIYGAQFSLSANFADNAISGSVNGGAVSEGIEIECVNSDDGTVVDKQLVTANIAYTTSFAGSLSEDGTFSVPLTIAGSTAHTVTQPFSDERCLHLNQQPPYSGSWKESGTISGFVERDGYIEVNTRWGSSAIFSGSWSGGGTVTSQ